MTDRPVTAEDWIDFWASEGPEDRCMCGNSFRGDNLCMPSACQWEGIHDHVEVEDDTQIVTPAQVLAARMVVDMQRENGEQPDEALVAISKASEVQRGNHG